MTKGIYVVKQLINNLNVKKLGVKEHNFDISYKKPKASVIKAANMVVFIPTKGDVSVIKSSQSFTFKAGWRV